MLSSVSDRDGARFTVVPWHVSPTMTFRYSTSGFCCCKFLVHGAGTARPTVSQAKTVNYLPSVFRRLCNADHSFFATMCFSKAPTERRRAPFRIPGIGRPTGSTLQYVGYVFE